MLLIDFVVVDETADLDRAARAIIRGASYDNNLLCIAEKEVFVVASVFDAMRQAMDRHFPEGVTWTRPRGGLFLWVTLPAAMRASDVLKAAIAQKVAFVPGESFFPDGTGQNTARLNFSYAKPEVTDDGIRRLGWRAEVDAAGRECRRRRGRRAVVTRGVRRAGRRAAF